MKNLQHNNPTLGAQGYNLVDKASDNVYVYGEKKSLIYNLRKVMIYTQATNDRKGTQFKFPSQTVGNNRIKQGDNLSDPIYSDSGGQISPTMPIDLYQPFYFGLLGEDGQTFTPLVRFYNFNEDNFISGSQPRIEFEEFHPEGIQIYLGSNWVDYTDQIVLDMSRAWSYTCIIKNADSEFSIELTYKQE